MDKRIGNLPDMHTRNGGRTGAAMRTIRRVKRAVWGTAAVFIMAGFLSMSVYAYTQTTGTVVPATANIRAEADTASSVVGSTEAGKTLTITDEVTGTDGSTWYQVIVDADTKGYIRSDLVKKAGGGGDSQASAGQSASQEGGSAAVTQIDRQSGWVTPKGVNVRKSAGTAADTVASVSRGTVVTVSGKAKGDDGKDWYQVSFTYNNKTISGFIRADLISFEEPPEEAPATAEITGTQSTAGQGAQEPSQGDGEGGEAQGETAPPEGTEGAGDVSGNAAAENPPEAADDPGQGGQTGSGSGSNITVLNAEGTPKLADGFKEVLVNMNGQSIRAWKNGDFYIFFGQDEAGNQGYYMYDSTDITYQRYYMESGEGVTGKAGIGGNTLKIITIVLAFAVVFLLILLVFLTVQLNHLKNGGDWDEGYDDDEEEELEEEELEEDYEDEEEEDEEDVEEYPAKRAKPVRKKSAQPVSRKVSPPEEYTGSKTAKPRNFLEVEEEVMEKPEKFKPVQDDLDPDDEDTFVFINLDGEDID